MTDLELYKFIQKNDIELRWVGDELIIWVDFYNIREFAEMIKDYSCEGVDVNLRQAV
jgi:hypothetical protein